mmetsp:Transcript_8558/g.13973  ORF Transcript_8558/g.13973 Transcript_8558/m.13973 type:complete len:292 (-) Transcript_8558:1407-2282(-)
MQAVRHHHLAAIKKLKAPRHQLCCSLRVGHLFKFHVGEIWRIADILPIGLKSKGRVKLPHRFLIQRSLRIQSPDPKHLVLRGRERSGAEESLRRQSVVTDEADQEGHVWTQDGLVLREVFPSESERVGVAEEHCEVVVELHLLDGGCEHVGVLLFEVDGLREKHDAVVWEGFHGLLAEVLIEAHLVLSREVSEVATPVHENHSVFPEKFAHLVKVAVVVLVSELSTNIGRAFKDDPYLCLTEKDLLAKPNGLVTNIAMVGVVDEGDGCTRGHKREDNLTDPLLQLRYDAMT